MPVCEMGEETRFVFYKASRSRPWSWSEGHSKKKVTRTQHAEGFQPWSPSTETPGRMKRGAIWVCWRAESEVLPGRSLDWRLDWLSRELKVSHTDTSSP